MLKVIKNPDNEYYEKVKKAVEENFGFCPCAIFKVPETKCMCKEFRDKDAPGFCHCKLYKKIEVDE